MRLPFLQRQQTPWAVLALSLLLTGVATVTLWINGRARDRAEFDNALQGTSERIYRRMDAYMALLRATSGLFVASQEVTGQEFERFVRTLRIPREYPGTQGLGFTERFLRQDRAAVEQWARTQGGHPEFRAWPDLPDEELHAIVLLEPLDERNQAAIGYNMYSEPVRREAMARARDSGEPALSGKVTLKQEIDERKQAGALIYMPVYRGGGVPDTIEGRRAALKGFVYSPLRAEDLFTGIFGGDQTPRAEFQIFDGPVSEPGNLLYGSGEMPAHPLLERTTELVVAGRPWTVVFASLPAFDHAASQRTALPFGLLGLAVSLALFALTRGQVHARAQAERTAEWLKVALEERANAERELREADRRKDEFLAMLAHELRNPMAPVLSAIQLMDRKLAGTGAAAHEREVIERQVNHMRRLVDDLLDVSRVTRGKIELKKVPLDLVPATQRAVDSVRSFAERRHHTLRVDLPPGPVWAEVDPVRFEQILTNVLYNAAKYSERGGWIGVSLEAQGGEAVIRIADRGVGISPEALEHIFEPFIQIGRTLDRAQGGLGLGLTLVQRLTELHGGRVEAASPGPGKGSTFTVRFPLLPADRVPSAASAPKSPPRGAPAGRRVLVVDDNIDAAQTLGEVLELDGHQVTVVHDGRAAVERIGTGAYDVVLLDIGLPGMDGYEVARRTRARPELARVRLVALTGYGQESDRARSREAGFDAHLVKPVDIEAVREQAALGAVGPEPARDQDGPSEPAG